MCVVHFRSTAFHVASFLYRIFFFFRVQISDRSRAAAGVSMDGRVSHVLNPGDSVTVQVSPYPVPCINRSSISEDGEGRPEEGVGPGKEDDWVRDINNLLQYNATFRSKALLGYSRT